MRNAIVVAPHPDDEVLGASAILSEHACTIVFVTDGVPPDVDDPALADARIAESRAAHAILDARVDAVIRLAFADQRLTDNVVELAGELVEIVTAHDGDVYVPAFQRGHPDHDAVYVAAQLARAELERHAAGNERRWFVYALYGLDHDGCPRFGWLAPDSFTPVTPGCSAPVELSRKAAALHAFESQRPDDSVLSGWLGQPVPEQYAPLPPLTTTLPDLRYFYEEVFEFSQFGIDPVRITATLEAALTSSQPD